MKSYVYVGVASLLFSAGNTVWAAEAARDVNGSGVIGGGVDTTSNDPGAYAPYVGIDAAQSSYFSYAGFAWAPDKDMTDPGLLFNVFGGRGGFRYSGADKTAGALQGSVSLVDALVGYQTLGLHYRLVGYVGIESTDVTLPPPDSNADTAGRETGAKVMVDFETNSAIRPYLGVSASYSDSFDSHSIRLRPGYRVGPYIVGGEFTFQGNRAGDFHRVGLFSHYEQNIGHWGQFSVSASGGWGYVDNGNDNFVGGSRNGPYGAMSFSLFF